MDLIRKLLEQAVNKKLEEMKWRVITSDQSAK